MTTPLASLPAHALLNVLQWSSQQPPTDVETDTAVRTFVFHLSTIAGQHRRKAWSERYLIDQVFSRARMLKNDIEKSIYAKCHLKVAIDQISKLIKNIQDPATGLVTASSATRWSRSLTDYVFDLKDIVPFLQRKVPGYEYLRGGKNPTVHSWELYRLANDLAYQSTFTGQASSFDHKLAQIASIGVLRQALELRFDRLVRVYPRDRKGRGPKLRHGFHQEFIAGHDHFFRFNSFNISDLKPVYDWCSEIVHQAYQPYAWQIDWALDLSGRLLNPQPAMSGVWSIANAVEINDVAAMQVVFERHFLDTYEHGEWQMTRLRPEALVRGWVDTMSFTADEFRPVSRRPSLWERLKRRWRSIAEHIAALLRPLRSR